MFLLIHTVRCCWNTGKQNRDICDSSLTLISSVGYLMVGHRLHIFPDNLVFLLFPNIDWLMQLKYWTSKFLLIVGNFSKKINYFLLLCLFSKVKIITWSKRLFGWKRYFYSLFQIIYNFDKICPIQRSFPPYYAEQHAFP